MRRTVMLLALAILGACTSERPNVLPTSTATPTATPADASDLAKLLPSETPEGYLVVDEQSGPLTLEEAAADADDPAAERARLQANGFLRGYSRTWQSPDTGDIVIVLVDEFSSEAGASREFDASLTEAKDTGATRFAVPEITGAAGLTQNEGEDTFHAVAFVRGNRLFLAAVGGSKGARDPAEAVELAETIVKLIG